MNLPCLLSIVFFAGLVNGAELSVSSTVPLIVVAPDQWKASKVPAVPFETYRIELPNDQNAVCLISVFDKDKKEFADPEFLKKLLRGDSRPYVGSPAELSKIEVKELKLDGGLGFYANFVDPDLVGKPVVKGKYKTATPIIMSVSSKYLVKITLLCDEIDGSVYRDAMTVVKSVKAK